MKWNEHQLETRDALVTYFTRHLTRELGKINPAFKFIRIETPVLLPFSVDNPTTQTVKIRLDSEELVLRQNTSTGAYEVSRDILSGKMTPRQRLPIVVWQHGKIFEENGGKIREKYSLEYQILFSKTTGMMYDPAVIAASSNMLYKQCGNSVETESNGIVRFLAEDNNDLLITIQQRNDFWAGNNIEMIVHLDAVTLASIRHEKPKRAATLKATT